MKKKNILCSTGNGLNSLILLIESLILSKIIELLFNLQFEFILGLLLLGLILLNYLISLYKDRLKNEIILYYKKEILNQIFSNHTKKQESANIVKILEKDCEFIMEFKCETLPNFIFGLAILLFYFVYCFNKNTYFTIIIFIFCLLQVIVPMIMAKYFAYNYEQTIQVEEDIENYYYVVVDKFKKTWFFNSTYFIDRLHSLLNQYYKVGMKSEFTAQLENMLLNFLNVLSQFGLYFVGLFLMWKSTIELPTLMSMVVLAKAMIVLSQSLTKIVKSFSILKVAKKRVNEVIEEDVELRTVNSFNQIHIDHMKVPFIKGEYNQELNKNELVLIKGKNGSGKSTLLKILLNIEANYSGNILMDNHNIQGIDLSCLAYYIPQNNALLDFTVHELFSQFESFNLTQMRKDFGICDELLDRKLKECSNGQIKKINIVCAFLSNKQILVFDEPENSLDEETISVFKSYLNKFEALIVIATNSNIYDELKCKVVRVHGNQ